MKTKITAIVLILTLTLSLVLSGCTEDIKDISDNIEPETFTLYDDIFKAEGYNDFSVKLLDECFEGKDNTLVAPLSAVLALAMVAEGADNSTLAEIETALGTDIEELRVLALEHLKEDTQLSTANSMWINSTDDFSVDDAFLQNNAGYHNAEVFEVKFNNKAVSEINNWVNEKTDGMIEKIIDKLDEGSVMCLINALLFDAKWQTPYNEHQVEEGSFVTEEGATLTADYLHGNEYYYLENENSTGFIKYYEGRKYAFAAMLPDEGVSVDEYVKTLDGNKLNELFENIQETTVYTKIPKFEYETDLSLKPVLMDMGMKKAFDEEKADFSKLGKMKYGNIYIGDVVHSTKITVAEEGTKAGAVTAAIVHATGAPLNPKEVYLERPFVYMIIDMENNIPVFMGTVMKVCK